MRVPMRVLATLSVWAMLAGQAVAQTVPPPAPPAAAEAGPDVTWGVEGDSLSRYLWRGIPYSYQGRVFWGTAWISTRGLTVTLFTNFDHRWRPHWNEADVSASYERTVGKVKLTGAYNWYSYYYDPNTKNYRTSELIGRVGLAAGPGEVYTTHAFDIQHYKGSYYAEVGYKTERELAPKWKFTADGSIAFWPSFSDKYFSDPVFYDPPIPSSTMGPLTVNAAVAYKLAEYLSVRPHVTFSRVLDETTRKTFDSYDDEFEKVNSRGVIVGVAVTIGR
jgi:hypothetical protein